MTLDDAAERRIRDLVSLAQDAYANTSGDFIKAVDCAIRTCWQAATEAAAKKCKAAEERVGQLEDDVHRRSKQFNETFEELQVRQAEVAVLRQAIMHMCTCVKNGEGATVISYMEMFKEDPGVASAITTVQIVLAGTSG